MAKRLIKAAQADPERFRAWRRLCGARAAVYAWREANTRIHPSSGMAIRPQGGPPENLRAELAAAQAEYTRIKAERKGAQDG